MAGKVSEQFIAEVKKYYEAQEPSEEWIKQATKQGPSHGHDNQSKPRFSNIQREKARKATKPLSDFKLPDGMSTEEVLKALGDLKLKANETKGDTGKKGSKS